MKLPLTNAIQWKKDEKEGKHDYLDLEITDSGIIWKKTFNFLEGFKSINGKDYRYKECILDLQTANDCFCADLCENELGQQYIHIYGSGMAELGYPFWQENFDAETYSPYDNNNEGHFLVIVNENAIKRFIKIAEQDYLPLYEEVVFNPQRDLRTLE